MKVLEFNKKNILPESGFTLIELMVVIAVIGIMSATTIYTYMGGNPDRRVRGAARDLYAGFRKASSEAINRSDDVTITFTFGATDSYTISDINGNIETFTFPSWIDLYNLSGANAANAFVYNSRGMINGVSGSLLIRYRPGFNAATKMGVRVTSAGGISLIDERSDAGYVW